MPDVKRDKPAKHPSVEEVPSTFGTLGTFGIWHGGRNATRSEVVSPLLGSSLNSVQNAVPGPLPGPADLIERIAILEDAEVQILYEAGFPSWQAYVDVLPTRLRCQIEAAQAPTTGPLARHWHALARDSLGFLTSLWWPLACRLGWALVELFGVRLDAPLVRLDGWGLAIAPALSGLARTRLVELTGEGAVFATLSGGHLSWPSFCGQRPEQVILWWEVADRQRATVTGQRLSHKIWGKTET